MNYSCLHLAYSGSSVDHTDTGWKSTRPTSFNSLFKSAESLGEKRLLDAVLAELEIYPADHSADHTKLDESSRSVRDVEQRIEISGKKVELAGLAAPSKSRITSAAARRHPHKDICETWRLMADIPRCSVFPDRTPPASPTTLSLNNDLPSSLAYPISSVDYMIHHLLCALRQRRIG